MLGRARLFGRLALIVSELYREAPNNACRTHHFRVEGSGFRVRV